MATYRRSLLVPGQTAGPVVQPGPHPAAAAQVGHPAGGLLDCVVFPDQGGGAGRPSGHELVEQPSQLARVEPLSRRHRAPMATAAGDCSGPGGTSSIAPTAMTPTNRIEGIPLAGRVIADLPEWGSRHVR
jgi:hypothetical protein